MRRRVPLAWQAVALAFLFCCGCATAPVHEHDDAAFGLAIIARVLADACTSRPTDAVLIEHATFLLQACHASPGRCLRRVCVRLGRGDDDEPFREAAR